MMVSRFLMLIRALVRQKRRLELRQCPTATDRSRVGSGPEFSPRGFGSSTMRAGVPSASNSALNLYPWMRVNFVKAYSDKSHSSLSLVKAYRFVPIEFYNFNFILVSISSRLVNE